MTKITKIKIYNAVIMYAIIKNDERRGKADEA